MSYIENLTGSEVQAGLQETLSLGVGNFKIRGFDLTNTGDYLVLSSGIALIDGLRVISTGNLQVKTSTALNKYIFLRINTYTRLENGITVRKANLSLIAQTLNIPVNSDDLYENITGTKDVLLAYVNDSGVVDLTTNGTLGVYDVPTRLNSVEGVNATQDTRLTNVETKNTEQDTRLTTLEAATPEADTGWVDIRGILNTANFTSTDLFARRIGKLVEIKGILDASKAHTTTTTSVPWTKNPSGLATQFLPSKAEKTVNIGSSFNQAWVELSTDGTGTIVRTTTNLAATNTSNINLKYTTN